MNVNYVVRYLLDDSASCMKYLNKIEEINVTRKDLTLQMSELAKRLADETKDFMIIRSEVFKEGLCGLIANRLLSQYNRPILILAQSDGILKGSGRAPEGFDMFGYLNEIRDLFTAYGGHSQAVGLSMDADRFDELEEFIETHPFDFKADDKDALYFKQEDLDNGLLEELKQMKPYGTGFKEPLLCIDGNYRKKYSIKGIYPKFILNEKLEAISFNTALANREFTMMLGHLKPDNYHKGNLSFVIEDLI